MKMVKQMEEENAEKIEMQEIPSSVPKETPVSNEVSEVTTGQPDVLAPRVEEQS